MIDFMDFSMATPKMPQITREGVTEAQQKNPKRICFATCHSAEPKRSSDPKYTGTINVPFGGGFLEVFPFKLWKTKNSRHTPDGYWRSISSEEEYQQISEWTKNQGQRIFLRDTLYASIAMGINLIDNTDGKHTELGQLEYDAKQLQDEKAIKSISDLCVSVINEFDLYRNADFICTPPPRPGKTFDLPSKITDIICPEVKKENITHDFSFGAEKGETKGVRLEDKWDQWEEAELTFNKDLSSKTIIILDDKYQSGTTMQYIAMKLQLAGAHQVYGLSVVKTLRDTDNS